MIKVQNKLPRMHYSAEVQFAEPLVEVGTFSCFKVKGNKSDGEQVLEKCFSQLINIDAL